MPEQVKKILDKIVAWWKNFNIKQRILVISATAVVLLALIILAVVSTKPNYITIYTAEDTKEASKVKAVLDSDSSIKYKVSDNGLIFQVDAKQEATAAILLGENDFPAATYDINTVTGGGFSRTESDRRALYKDFLEKKFRAHLMSLDVVDDAAIDITLPDNDGTILSKEKNAKAAVRLTLNGTIGEDQAAGLGQYIATMLGNESTEGVNIIDTLGNVIFSGTSENSLLASSSSQLSHTEKWKNNIKSEIKSALTNSHVFSDVNIAYNLNINYDTMKETSHKWSYPDGLSSGVIDSRSEYNSISKGGTAGVPGTDSNDDTTYVVSDNEYTYSEISSVDTKYNNNEVITETTSSGGKQDFENSSITVIATKYKIYKEELLEGSEELGDMTYEEFKLAHNEPVKIETDDDYISMIATATGLKASNITFLVYEQPEFIDKTTAGRSISDYLQIALAVLIFALLGFVVFRSTRKSKEEEIQPELSVDDLLVATSENTELEDIGYTEKSEARILIEKFVDETPDAVALLLRNWLNEEWD